LRYNMKNFTVQFHLANVICLVDSAGRSTPKIHIIIHKRRFGPRITTSGKILGAEFRSMCKADCKQFEEFSDPGSMRPEDMGNIVLDFVRIYIPNLLPRREIRSSRAGNIMNASY
jgi:hypothetical protein